MLSSLKSRLKGKCPASSSSQQKESYAVLRNDESSSDDSDNDEENMFDEQQSEGTNVENNITEETHIIPDISSQERLKKKAPRGPNKCGNLSSNEKTIVSVNINGQPIGKHGRILSSYLGLLARDPKLVPFDLNDWRKFLNKEKEEVLWKIILTRFTFEGPTSPKDWSMEKIDSCLRSWRTKLKQKHYKPEEKSLEELLVPLNTRVDLDQWANIVRRWESKEGKDCSNRNFDNRMKSTMAHHLGTKSLARLREEMTAEDGEAPDRLKVFEKAYGDAKKKPVDPISEMKLASVKNHKEKLPPDCDIVSERDKIFELVVGEDKRGYKRTYGIGVKVSTKGNSMYHNTEARHMVEEVEKRKTLEEEVEIEKQKRLELEQGISMETEKRKELEENMLSEKRKREALEE
ncbi:uncharacterized protein LOC110696579 [Chenopodium quinoa]|uniref:uncharacterized protein LOC110696579 n=1 Tax=Chenopodium quinoa TaxID=63459 RepID=UPI000B7998EB|nr:uncharacterized protein LOC110696579 [Chenopodium quinoa]XP_021729614.1 uncharacterized protein LOC110696579 [Chenopodium quinoa]XP_021729623.1 uncharacterized protein LOC110696579 [Chenopodium quinoa]XP_021729630.1 uncharacterized protein LOC110696579 [Chenopodium quinoa]